METLNSKQVQNPNAPNTKVYDLDERTETFARACRVLIKQSPRTIAGIEDGKQLARSSGSVAANYIEASEAVSQKDFYFRIKICRKEAKESRLWLRLMDVEGDLSSQRDQLVHEVTELMRIFGAIIKKVG
ncbi:MAG: four helix bundle protein [Candidatus Peregrinibacteria bacterium]|nr:four helix bundle protein [Candidatus Peregrinibacteria bacterium]